MLAEINSRGLERRDHRAEELQAFAEYRQALHAACLLHEPARAEALRGVLKTHQGIHVVRTAEGFATYV
jgi:hypothetical protein